MRWLRGNEGKKGLEMNQEREPHKTGRGQKGCLFVLDYFSGIASVCSSCGRWINSWGCLSVSVSLVFLQRRTANFFFSLEGPISYCQPLTVLASNWWHLAETVRPAEVLWVCTSREKTDTQQQQSSGWDLAVIMLLHPSCFSCSSNPLLCPSAWQSHTWCSLILAIKHKHTSRHPSKSLLNSHRRVHYWVKKKQSQQMSRQFSASVCCHNRFCHYVIGLTLLPPFYYTDMTLRPAVGLAPA